MRLIAVLLTFALLSLMPKYTARACSFSGPPVEEWIAGRIDESTDVVIGSYAQLDDQNTNGILRVTDYLKGSGAEYLLIRHNPVEMVANDVSVGRMIDGCGYLTVETLTTQGSYVYFLNRTIDGIYQVQDSFYTLDGVTATGYGGDIALLDLRLQIGLRVGQGSTSPDYDGSRPRLASMLITTEDEQHYLLPADSTYVVPVGDHDLVERGLVRTECAPPPCAAVSPIGLDHLYLVADAAAYAEIRGPNPDAWEVEVGYSRYYAERHAFIGQRASFSSTSDTVLVWNDDAMQIYTLAFPANGYPAQRFDPYQQYERTELFAGIIMPGSAEFPVAWSPDGRVIAFSTRDGLYLWDALTAGAQPELLIPASDGLIPVVRQYSPGGRYLAVTHGARRYHLDLFSGAELPDGYISPDDRKLIAFDTSADVPTEATLIFLTPGRRESAFYPGARFSDLRWRDNLSFVGAIYYKNFYLSDGHAMRLPTDNADCTLVPGLVERPFRVVRPYIDISGPTSLEWMQANPDGDRVPVIYAADPIACTSQMKLEDRFVYQNGVGVIAISMDDTRINGIDLGLDSPIASAEWLRSPFYFDPPR